MASRHLSIAAWVLVASCQIAPAEQRPLNAVTAGGDEPIVWKAVVVAGSDREAVFDNARRRVSELLRSSGVEAGNIKQLSASQQVVRMDPSIRPATASDLETSLRSLDLKPGDGCFVYMTSHGDKDGFALAERRPLAPEDLQGILGRTCGGRPTIVVVSACYSGIFINDALATPNRIILTAAAADRPSFGCAPGVEFNYWDRCFIESFAPAAGWDDLARTIRICVERRETATRTASSNPQWHVGAAMRTVRLADRLAGSAGS